MDKKVLIISLILGVWLISLTVFSFSSTGNTIKSEEKWICNKAECTETYSPIELQQKFCVFESNDFFCSVESNGQIARLPMSQINWTAVSSSICKKAKCVEEIRVKEVDYEINISQAVSN